MNPVETAVREIKNGQVNRFEEIIQEYQQKLFQYCFHMLGNGQEAEDAVQEVFFNVYRKLSTYESNTSFSGWIYKIACHHCINQLRKRKLISFVPFIEESGMESSTLDSEVFRNELSQALCKSLDKLAPPDRNIFILRVLEDKSYAELEEILKIKQTTIRKKFERTRKKLNNLLQTKNPNQYFQQTLIKTEVLKNE